jgi:hypothetical protein
MPVIATKTNKSIYYVDEIFKVIATVHCDTVGGWEDHTVIYGSQDRVKWVALGSLEAAMLCGPLCVLGCTNDWEIDEISIQVPGTWYIGVAMPNVLYPPIDVQFKNNPGSVKQITILSSLPTGYGAVKFVTTPSMATVYLDGNQWAEDTPTVVTAPAGDHEIRLVSEGYVDFTVRVNFRDGLVGEVSHTFSDCDLLCQITQTIEDNALLIGVGAAVVIGAILVASMTSPGQRKRLVKDSTRVAKSAYNKGKKFIREKYPEEE